MSTDHRRLGRHEAAGDGAPATGLVSELRQDFSPRTWLLVVGVLALQLGFIASYVGAFHNPQPQEVPLAVVAPAQLAQRTVTALNSLPDRPLRASAASDAATARQQIEHGDIDGALIVDPATTTDTLLIASGRGSAVATALQETITLVEASQQRTVTVTDTAALQPGDGRGLTGFYTVIGWLVGGYLVAAILGVSIGTRATSARRAALRLAAMVPYAIVSGLGGALLIDPILNALTGHFLALAGIGTALVMAAATVTMALEALLGVVGIGVTLLLFVVLGNPSAGGPYQAPLLPPFWRAIGGALPNGAGTTAVRNTVYFGGHSTGGPLLVIAGWAIGGVLVTVAATTWHPRRTPHRIEDGDRAVPRTVTAETATGRAIG